jgi:hypothetical protein
MAGHNETMALSWVRVGNFLNWPGLTKGSVPQEDRGQVLCGTQGIASEYDLFPADSVLPWTGGTPWAFEAELFVVFFIHSIGGRPQIFNIGKDRGQKCRRKGGKKRRKIHEDLAKFKVFEAWQSRGEEGE